VLIKIIDRVLFVLLGIIWFLVFISWLVGGFLIFPKFIDVFNPTLTNISGLRLFVYSLIPATLFFSYIGFLVYLYFKGAIKLSNSQPFISFLAQFKKNKKGHEVPV